MYDDTYNICIKCIRIKKANTVHCAVCNLCIDDWDHHCFWLNACISKNNMKIFTCFLISIISFLFINIVFLLNLLIDYFTEDNKIRNHFLNNIFTNKKYDNDNEIWKWKLIYLLFLIVFFMLFLFLFTYNFSLILFSTPKSLKAIEVNDLRGPSYLDNNYSDDYHTNLIDSSVDKSDD